MLLLMRLLFLHFFFFFFFFFFSCRILIYAFPTCDFIFPVVPNGYDKKQLPRLTYASEQTGQAEALCVFARNNWIQYPGLPYQRMNVLLGGTYAF